ncbi:kynurenine formamidase-like isoform X2 [Rhopilema esculentum]|uniref:kynurenine formamidase-like isoform X2 n=1 Tax=Rhopilema esculentum TaxID=499914 RepID=UPI0031D6E7C4
MNVRVVGASSKTMDEQKNKEKQKCNKEFLEHQYSPSRWSNVASSDEIIQLHVKKITEASTQTIKKVKCDVDVQYGQSAGERMDVFFPKSSEKREKQPILVFIHGGYWQELGKDYYSFLGSVFGQYGITTIVVGYELAPKVKLKTIAGEIRNAVCSIHERFPSAPLIVSGHSAGAHLASLLLTVNWNSLGFSRSPVQGLVLISGVYDLRPLVNTYVNDALNMNTEEALMLSPMCSVDQMEFNSSCKIMSLVGQYESPEFHRQSKEFAEALRNAGYKVKHDSMENTDHFSIVHNFTLPSYNLTKVIVDFINDVSQICW